LAYFTCRAKGLEYAGEWAMARIRSWPDPGSMPDLLGTSSQIEVFE